jgi:hypothetical protein
MKTENRPFEARTEALWRFTWVVDHSEVLSKNCHPAAALAVMYVTAFAVYFEKE